MINSSVSRAYLEPSTAVAIHHQLGLPTELPELRPRQRLPRLRQRDPAGRDDDRRRPGRVRAASSTARDPATPRSARSPGSQGADVTAADLRAAVRHADPRLRGGRDGAGPRATGIRRATGWSAA